MTRATQEGVPGKSVANQSLEDGKGPMTASGAMDLETFRAGGALVRYDNNDQCFGDLRIHCPFPLTGIDFLLLARDPTGHFSLNMSLTSLSIL